MSGGLGGLLAQLLNGLAGASTLFLVAAGLSLIFGVTRIVNFAHGSFYMLGLYGAYTLATRFEAVLGFWPAVLLAPLAVGALGALIEVLLLRRIYPAPELFQLLATFALVLVIQDAALWAWGPEELLGPRAPGLEGASNLGGLLGGRAFPQYDLLLIAAGPLVLGAVWLLLNRTRWGTLVRAAAQDREMAAALGVNQAWLFTGVFALGALLAGLGGALQLPRESANLGLDLHTIGDAFVVVVVGGMGSLPGAYWAALLIAQAKALCAWLGVVQIAGIEVSFSKLTLVVEFLVMATVLVLRPWGLMGKPLGPVRLAGFSERALRPAGRAYRAAVTLLLLALALLPLLAQRLDAPYALVLLVDVLIAALFAASLHLLMGPGGLHSFGHAAYFGLGAYGAALGVQALGLRMEWAMLTGPLLAALGAALLATFAVRLSGVYLAMLTLAFAQIVWAIAHQWDTVTGGSNGLTGVWPADWLADRAHYFWWVLALVAAKLWGVRRLLHAPLGLALRAGRDSPQRALAIGIDVARVQWLVFVMAGALAGLAGTLFAFSKGSISPESLGIGQSVNGLVMVLLGGVQTLAGPVVGAAAFSWLQDALARSTEYWRAALGGIVLVLVLLFPQGLAGAAQQLGRWLAARLGPGGRAA